MIYNNVLKSCLYVFVYLYIYIYVQVVSNFIYYRYKIIIIYGSLLQRGFGDFYFFIKNKK